MQVKLIEAMEAVMDRHQIILIDSDVRRRAQISHALTNLAAFVIPLEHYSEISQAWPDDAIILIEDRGDSVASLHRMMQLHNRALPVVVLTGEASALRKSELLFNGATACLPWPCDIARIKTTVQAIFARRIRKAEPHTVATSPEATPSSFPQLVPAQSSRADIPAIAATLAHSVAGHPESVRRSAVLIERPLVHAAPDGALQAE